MEKIKYKGKELLPPKSDLVFKAIFGTEDGKELLAAFLADVLGLEIEGPEDIEILNSEITAEQEGGKVCLLDIRVRVQRRVYINVEIQLGNEGDMVPRSLCYNAKMFVSQQKKGMKYKDVGSVISLIIVDFVLFKDELSWYNSYILRNCESGRMLTDLLRLSFVELPKALEALKEHRGARELTAAEKWSLFLSAKDEEVLDMLAKESPQLEKAVKKLERVSEDEKLRVAYELQEKAEMDYYSRVVAPLKEIEERSLEIEERSLEIEERSLEIEERSLEIEERSLEIQEQEQEIQEQTLQMEVQRRALAEKNAEIEVKAQEIEMTKREVEMKLLKAEAEKEKASQAIARSLKKAGVDAVIIAESTGLTKEEIEAL